MNETVEKFQRILQTDPQNTEALRGLLDFYETQEQSAEINKTRSDLLCRLGDVYSKTLDNRIQAIDCYVQALELDYTKQHLLQQIGDIYAEKNENFTDIIEHLKRQADSTSSSETRLSHWYEIAEIYNKVLSQPEPALSFYQKILHEDPFHRLALEAIENIYVQTKQWTRLISFLEEVIEHLGEQSSDKSTTEIVSIYFQMAAVFRDRLDMPFEAMQIYEHILEIAPNSLQVRTFINKILSQVSTWKRIAQDFWEKAKTTRKVSLRSDLLQKSAKIYVTYLRDLSQGLQVYKEILSTDPQDQGARQAVHDILAKNGSWEEWVEVLEGIAAKTSDLTKRAEILNAIGQVYQQRMALPQLAINAFRRSVEIDPQNNDALQALELLYGETKDWTALVLVLKALLPLRQSKEQKIPLMEKLARIHLRFLREPMPALELYREILEKDANHVASLRALEKIYQEDRDWDGLQKVYSRLLQVGQEPSRQLDTLKKYASLLINHSDEPKQSVQLLKRAQVIAANDPSIVIEMERLYSETQDWAELAHLYEGEATKSRTPQAASSWYLKAAQIYERHLDNSPIAVDLYRRALEHSPENLKIIRALQAIFERVRNWEALIDLCQKELASYPPQSQESVPLLLRIAETLEYRAADIEEATRFYRQTLAIQNDNPVALKALERLFLRKESWQDLLEVYYQQLSLLEPLENITRSAEITQSTQLLRRMAALYTDKIQDPNQAISVFERLLKMNPQDTDSIASLKFLYEDRSKWTELVNTLEREILTTKEPIRHASIYTEIASIFTDKLHDMRMAQEYLQKAYQKDPGNSTLALRLLSECERNKDWPRLVKICAQQLEPQPAGPNKVALLLRMGHTYDRKLHQPQEAIDAYVNLLQLEPHNPEALSALKELYSGLERWEDLAQVFERLLTQYPSGTDKRDLHLQLGELYQNRFQRIPDALGQYQKALAENPNNPPAISAIRSTLQATGNWSEYLRYTQKQTEVSAHPADKADLLIEMAQIWRDRFQQTNSAVENFQQALRFRANDPTALAGLFALLVQEKQWQDVEDIGLKLLHVTEDENEILEVRKTLGWVYAETLYDLDRAVAMVQAAVTIDSKDPVLLRRLRDLQIKRRDWNAVIRLTYQMIDLLEPDQKDHLNEKISFLFDIANTWLNELNSFANAERTLREILKQQPLNEKALELLGSIVQDPEVWKEIEEQVVEGFKDNPPVFAKSKSLNLLAHFWDSQFHSPRAAIRCLEHSLEVDSAHLPTLRALSEILFDTSDWTRYLEISKIILDILEKRLTKVSRPDRQDTQELLVWHLIRCAEVSADSLSHNDDAIAFLNRAHQLDPDHPEVWVKLEPLLIQKKDWDALTTIYEQALKRSKEKHQQISFNLKLGNTWLYQLENEERAETFLLEVLALDPKHIETLENLCRIRESRGHWPEILDTYALLANALGPSSQSVNLYLKMAKISLEQQNDASAAEQWGLKGLEIDGRNTSALHFLQNLYEKQRRWDELLKAYQREATLFLDEGREIQLQLSMGRVWEEEFSEFDKASQAFQRVLELDPVNNALWKKARAFFERHERWSELAQALNQRMQYFENQPEDLAQLHFDLGRVWVDHLEERERGLAQFEQVLRINPRHHEALDRLIALYRTSHRYEPLVETLEKKLNVTEDKEQSIALLVEMAQIWDQELGIFANAEETYRHLIRLDPHHSEGLHNLATLYKKRGRWDAYTNTLQDRIEAAESKTEKIKLFLDIAECGHIHLKDSSRAVEAYESAIQLDPTNPKAIAALESLYEGQGNWQAYVDMLQLQSDRIQSPKKLFSIRQKQGDIYLTRLGRLSPAATCFEAALSQIPKLQNISVETAENHIFTGLRQIYRKTQEWQNLVRVLAQMEMQSTSKMEKVELIIEKAQVEENELRDLKQAAQSWRDILTHLPSHKGAISHLLELLDAQKDRNEVIRLKTQMLNLESELKQKSALHLDLATLYAKDLPERDRHLAKALECNPHNPDALFLRRNMALKKQDWQEAKTILEKERTLFKVEEDKEILTTINTFLGNLALTQFENGDEALRFYQNALVLTPHHPVATLGTAHILFNAQQWQEAEPFYEQLSLEISSQQNDPSHSQLQDSFYSTCPDSLSPSEVCFRLATIEQHLGKIEKAIMYLQQSLQYEPKNLHTLSALSELFFTQEQWTNSIPIFETLLNFLKTNPAKHRDRIISTHLRLGNAHLHCFRDKQQSTPTPGAPTTHDKAARKHFKKVLDREEEHPQALRSWINLEIIAGNWTEAVAVIEKFLTTTKDEGARVEVLFQKGDILSQHLNLSDEAVEVFQKVLKSDPGHQDALRSLIDLHLKKRQWTEALHYLKQLEPLVSDPTKRADLLCQQAQIYSREIGDQSQALAVLHHALESVSNHGPSLEETASIHRRGQHWDKLLEHLRYCLRVIPENQTEALSKVQLEIGELLFHHFDQPSEAEKTFREVLARSPQDHEARVSLARLHGLDEGQWPQAIQEYQDLLQRDISFVQGFRELFTLEKRLRHADRTFCFGSILEFLGHRSLEANEPDGFAQELERQRVSARELFDHQITNNLSIETWEEELIHPEERGFLQTILRHLEPQLSKVLSPSPSIPTKDPAVRTDMNIRSASRVFGQRELKIRAAKETLTDKQIVENRLSAQIVVSTEFEEIPSDAVQRFLAARNLYYLFAGTLPVFYYSGESLKQFFVALGRHFYPNLAPGIQSTEEFEQLHRNFKKTLSRGLKKEIKEPMKRFAEEIERIDFDRWILSTRHSANRVGLLTCQEPKAALLAIALYPLPFARRLDPGVRAENIEKRHPEDRAQWLGNNQEAAELIRFAISENYTKARRKLGIVLPDF